MQLYANDTLMYHAIIRKCNSPTGTYMARHPPAARGPLVKGDKHRHPFKFAYMLGRKLPRLDFFFFFFALGLYSYVGHKRQLLRFRSAFLYLHFFFQYASSTFVSYHFVILDSHRPIFHSMSALHNRFAATCLESDIRAQYLFIVLNNPFITKEHAFYPFPGVIL